MKYNSEQKRFSFYVNKSHTTIFDIGTFFGYMLILSAAFVGAGAGTWVLRGERVNMANKPGLPLFADEETAFPAASRRYESN